MSIDPRLIERRKTVAEHNAKRNISRLLRFLAGVVVVGALIWLAFSPWLSVSQVSTTGVSASTTNAILADHGVIAGTPMIRISVTAVESALLDDPWVAEARVEIDWPDRVTVDVVERAPVAWALTSDGWTRRALDAVALPSEESPDDDLPQIEMADVTAEDALTDGAMIGALEFAAALPPDLGRTAMIRLHEGEIWASVAGFQVRLGRPVEMAEKATSLSALLNEDLVEGSTLVLVAPTNPAVMTPDTAGEDLDDDS